MSADKRDAARYRFLRSKASRDHKHHTRRALCVGIVDWGKNLGAHGQPNGAFWSRKDIEGAAMDRAVDAAMKGAK